MLNVKMAIHPCLLFTWASSLGSLLLLVFSLSLSELGCAVEIIVPPVNQTVALDSEARFSCQTAKILGWHVKVPGKNTSFIDYENAVANPLLNRRGICVGSRSDLGNLSILLVNATEENNGTLIKCRDTSSDLERNVESKAALLLVFGPPSTPSNVRATSSQHLESIVLWDPVFALSGEKVSYRVEVTNLTDNTSFHKQVSETSYAFSYGGRMSCDAFQFRVLAVNEAGVSEFSTAVKVALPTLPILGKLRSAVTLNHDTASAKVMFEAASACPSYPVTHYNVTVSSGGMVTSLESLPPNETEINFSSADGLRVNAFYHVCVTAVNSIGSDTSELNFTTTDVQLASSNTVDTTILVTCIFAAGSLARGCHITATPFNVKYHQRVDVMEANIPRSDATASNASGLLVVDCAPAECYSVAACDWEEDGSIGNVCIVVYEPQGNLAEYCAQLVANISSEPSECTTDIMTGTVQTADSKSIQNLMHIMPSVCAILSLII